MSHMWNGVSEKYFGNSSVAKQTILPATMGGPLHLWVEFGDPPGGQRSWDSTEYHNQATFPEMALKMP